MQSQPQLSDNTPEHRNSLVPSDPIESDLFRLLVQNSSDIITILDAEGTIRFQSPSIQRVLGYRPEDRVGKNAFRDPLVHPDDVAQKRGFLEAAIRGPGETVTAGFRLRHADGTWRHIEAVGTNLLGDPRIAGIVANYRDVTERVQFERALHESEARYRLLVENLMDHALFTTDPEGIIKSWN